MDRLAFEQLVSAWLSEPDRADLRAQIDAALAAQPELAAIFDEWRRFDALLARGWSTPANVNWPRLKDRIVANLDQPQAIDAEPDDALDSVLRDLPSLDARIDWSRLHGRISQAVARSTGTAARRRRLYTGLAATAASLTAAAALLLAFLPHGAPPTAPAGLVRVTLSPPATVRSTADAGVAFARISAPSATAAAPQRLFVVDPLIMPAEPSVETAGYY